MSNKIKTQVLSVKCKWDREAYIEINDKEVVFDTSGDEYGPVYFDLDLLEKKIKEHRDKLKKEDI